MRYQQGLPLRASLPHEGEVNPALPTALQSR
jgi:hypothetical protein